MFQELYVLDSDNCCCEKTEKINMIKHQNMITLHQPLKWRPFDLYNNIDIEDSCERIKSIIDNNLQHSIQLNCKKCCCSEHQIVCHKRNHTANDINGSREQFIEKLFPNSDLKCDQQLNVDLIKNENDKCYCCNLVFRNLIHSYFCVRDNRPKYSNQIFDNFNVLTENQNELKISDNQINRDVDLNSNSSGLNTASNDKINEIQHSIEKYPFESVSQWSNSKYTNFNEKYTVSNIATIFVSS